MVRKSHLFDFIGAELTNPRHLTGYIITDNEGIPEELSFLADSCIYFEHKTGNVSLGTIVFSSGSEVFYLAEGDLLGNLDKVKAADFISIGRLQLSDYDQVRLDTTGWFTPDKSETDIFGNTDKPWLTTRILDIVHSRNGPIIDFERVLVQAFYSGGILDKLQDKYRVS